MPGGTTTLGGGTGDTLGGGAGDTLGSGMVCRLGDGAREGQGAAARRRACAIREGAGAEGGSGRGWCAGLEVSREKIALRSFMARNWASPGVWYGAFGCGLVMASARAMAAWVASSAGEEEGTAQLWGKNSTVMLSRSPRVEGM